MLELRNGVKVVQVRELRKMLKSLVDGKEPVVVRRNSVTCAVLLPLQSKSYHWSVLERGERTALKDALAAVIYALDSWL